MINKYIAHKYCRDDLALIENYDKAIADQTQTWQCHHRRETIYTRKGLIEIGEYFKRPAAELIFLTKADHTRLHKYGNKNSLGKRHTAESKTKMSIAAKAGLARPEVKERIRQKLRGRKLSEAHVLKLKEAARQRTGTKYWNNGVTCVRTRVCPAGFVAGRLSRSRRLK